MGTEVKCNETVNFCGHSGCSAKFSRNNRLIWHQRVHTEERPFVCSVEGCNKSYTRPFHLTRHKKIAHGKKAETTIKCTEDGCDKVLSSKHTLYKHIKNFHKKRQFKCTECSKMFMKHQHLKIHSYEHTGILPYVCPVENCKKGFLLPSKLKVHEKIHKGYSCDVPDCKEVFNKWSLLRRHQKVDHQKIFKCSICDRTFYTKSNLEAHLETHDPDRDMFCCPFKGCSRAYKHERNLSDHIRKIHEKQRIKCEIENCDRTFSTKQAQKRHLKQHDPNKPLLSKKKRKAACRRKWIATKSAASIISGFKPDPSEDKKLLKRSIIGGSVEGGIATNKDIPSESQSARIDPDGIQMDNLEEELTIAEETSELSSCQELEEISYKTEVFHSDNCSCNKDCDQIQCNSSNSKNNRSEEGNEGLDCCSTITVLANL